MISIIQGDVIEVLRDYPDESFTACFCDPPYGLKFMGKEWDHGVPASPYWAEILRVLKPGAVLMAFSGTRTWHRLDVAIEDAGFELFDTMMWLHGQGMPKSLAIDKAIDKEAGAERKVIGQRKGQGSIPNDRGKWGLKPNTPVDITLPATDAAKTWDGYGINLKPSFEPILLAHKPRNTTFAQTAIEHGSSALNIAGCRIPSAESYTINTWDDGAKPFGDGAGHPFTSRQQSGRWPANVIHDGSDEVVGLFPQSNKHSAARFFYCAKANRRERDAGLEEMPKVFTPTMGDGIGVREHNPEQLAAWVYNPHTTIKPLALCKYLATLIVPPEDYRDEADLLIPFAGVLSEAIGAVLAGWRNITTIELEKDYCEIGYKRINWWIAKIQETGLTDPKAILKICGRK